MTTPITSTELSEQQVTFFETFGFLHLPELFLPEIATITEGFEEVFRDHQAYTYEHDLHYGKQRTLIGPGFIDRSPKLSWLRDDPRLQGVVSSLLGNDVEYVESDGNRFGGSTAWHCDIYGSPLELYRIKCYFYLDPLTADSGALRVIPGSHHYESSYAVRLRSQLDTPTSTRATLGIDERAVPSWVIETQPGDLVVAMFRTLHATFGGSDGRRLFTVNFGRPAA